MNSEPLCSWRWALYSHPQDEAHKQYVWQRQPSPSKAFNTSERRAALLDYSQQAAANTADGHPQGLCKWEKKKNLKDQQLRNFNINNDKQSVGWIIIYTETDNPVVMLCYTSLWRKINWVISVTFSADSLIL